jgi:hypothetical protein
MTQQAQLQEFYRDQRLKRELQKDELYARHGIAWIKTIRSLINTRYGNIVSKKELLNMLDKLIENDEPKTHNKDIYNTYTEKDIEMLNDNNMLLWNKKLGILEK